MPDRAGPGARLTVERGPTKHAVEGYSESLDHELREHWIRVLLVEPAYTNTDFEANTAWSDTPLPVYAAQQDIARDVQTAAMHDADDPAMVAKVVVAAAVAAKPRVRYPQDGWRRG